MTQEEIVSSDRCSSENYVDRNGEDGDKKMRPDLKDKKQACISTNKKYFQRVDDDELRRLVQDEAMQLPDMDIAVSGMAGRFPKSDSVNEFENNLRNGVDMVQDKDNTRFTCGLWGLPPRAGRLNDLTRFDFEFFGFTQEEANYVDYQLRILYEVVYESILDAGVNPADIRGSKTGVFFGLHCNEFENAMADEPGFKSNGYYAQFALKVAQYFDFRGMTITFDAACASGFVGLHNAVQALDEGIVDQAVVCSSNIPIHPTGSFIFFQMQMLSPTGYSRFLDSKADGYVKSEACVSVFLQRKTVAFRNYASIMATSTSVDGYKPEGITFPSDKSQERLIRQTKDLVGLSMNHVEYLEAHGTGTPAGDPQEASAISSVYIPAIKDGGENEKDDKTEKRSIGPLLVGSVKTNMGHSEAASGLCALTKVALMLENEIIYKSLHFDQPNANIEALMDGRLKFVDENQVLRAKIIPLSCYGFGGSNVHAILRASEMPAIEDSAEPSTRLAPRLVVMFGRGKQPLDAFFDQMLEKNKRNTRHCLGEDFLALLDRISSNNIDRMMNWRGYMLIDESSTQLVRKLAQVDLNAAKDIYEDHHVKDSGRRVHIQDCLKRDCILLFSGLGSEWLGMAAGLQNFPQFWSTIERLNELLEDCLDLVDCLINSNKSTLSSMCAKFVTITAFQIALTNIIKDQLKMCNISSYIGHSLGEISCAYAAGLFDEREAIMVAYQLGMTLDEVQPQIAGRMIALSMSKQEVERLFKKKFADFDVVASTIRLCCINGPNSVTLSGRTGDMDWLCNELRLMNIEYHLVDDSFALHNDLVMDKQIRDKLEKAVKRVLMPLTDYNRAQTGWISTSADDNKATQANAQYFVTNLCTQVDLLGSMMKLAPDCIVIELGPSGIFGSQVRTIQYNLDRELASSLPKQTKRRRQNGLLYARLMEKNVTSGRQVEKLMSSLGDLYLAGVTFNLQEFYNGPLADSRRYHQSTGRNQLVQVRRQTPSLSSLFRWNHEHKLFVPRYPMQFSKSSAKSEMPVDIVQDRDKFLAGHCIEGRVLYPATGYLLLIWRVFSFTKRRIYDACFHDVEKELVPIEFRNVRLLRAIILGNRVAQIYIHYEEATGRFEIKEGGSVVVEGYAFSPSENPKGLLHEDVRARIESEQLQVSLGSDDVYKQFRVSGYDYGETFRNIEACSIDGRYCQVKFNGYFVALTDSILQSIFLAIAEYAPSGGLFLPTRFDYVRFQPEIILKKMHAAGMGFDLLDGSLNTKEKRKAMTKMMQRQSGFVDKNQPQDEDEDDEEDADADVDEGEDARAKPKCIFETFCDPLTGVIITDGIEMRGIKATPAPRRQDNNEVLLESYQFTRDIEEPVDDERLTRYRKELKPYVEVCDTLSVGLLSRVMNLNGYIGQISSHLGESLVGSDQVEAYKRGHLTSLAGDNNMKRGGAISSDETVDEKKDGYNIKENGSRALLSVLDQLQAKDRVTLQTVSDTIRENNQYLVHDLIQKPFSSERFIRPIVEIVLDNCCTKKMKLRLLEINQGNGLLCNDLYKLITSVEPSITLDYNLAHSDLQHLSDIKALNSQQQKQSIKTHNLKNLTQLLSDKQLKSMDVIVYKDESCYKLPQNFEENNPQELITNLHSATQVGRYLLLVLRTSLTLAERMLLCLSQPEATGLAKQDLDTMIASGDNNKFESLWKQLRQVNAQLQARSDDLLREANKDGKLVCLARKSDPNGCQMILFKRLAPENPTGGSQPTRAGQDEHLVLRITHDDKQSIDDWMTQLKENFCATNKANEMDETYSSHENLQVKDKPKKVWLCAVATKDKPINGLIGMMQALRKELGSEHLRCYYDLYTFRNSKEPISVEQIVACDRFRESNRRDQIWNCIDSEGYNGAYRHLTANSYLSYDDCCCNKDESTENQLLDNSVDTDKSVIRGAYVNNATRGDLSSFTWYEAPMLYLGEEERQQVVRVAYSALNFRDIMLATGRLPLDAIPIRLALCDCLLGLEFSGVDSQGKRVMGMVFGRGIATHVICPSESAIKLEIPSWMSLSEAATVPVVYATAIMAIVYRGRARRGESILIHAGSGGVGQAAIRLAAHLGLEIYATVGSKEKREFLLQEFGYCLKEDHILNSRDTSFETAIMTSTRGRGVDLVLNSLADDKLQASLRCLADGGRFLEIGKYDMSVDSRMELIQMDTNKTFHGILLDKLFDTVDVGPSFKKQLKMVLQTMQEGLNEKTGFIKPIKYTMFKRNQIEEAFRFMATGKHIGKVLVEIEPKLDRKPTFRCSPNELPAFVPRFQLSPHKSYIVTGGLGGFGLELIKWLVGVAGARRLILTSRSGVRTGYQQATLRRLEMQVGAEFLVVDQKTADATEVDGARHLCEMALDFSVHKPTEAKDDRLGGIFHLAMVLKDSLLENMRSEDFAQVCRPKVNTCVNLDRLTREMSLRVDYFVAFSSVTSGKGNAGQANYAYANSCLERVCEQRRSDQMHGLAIQWGAIGDVGVAFENLGGNDIVIGGTMPQRMPSCFATLSKLLCSPFSTVLSVLPVNKSADKSGDRGDLVGAIMHVLGIKDASKVSDEATLGDLGLDSLMAVEIRQYIEREYDLTLNIQEIRSLTIAKIREISESERPAKAANALKDEQAAAPVEVASYGSKLSETGSDPRRQSKRFTEAAAVFNKDLVSSFVPQLRLPLKDWCKLNDATGSRPLFFIPPIHGRFDKLREICRHIRRPCVGLNWTSKCGKASSVDEAVEVYLDLIERTNWNLELSPQQLANGSTGEDDTAVDLVGYSFGATIAFELMVAIQKRWLLQLSQLKPGRLSLMDGSPKQIELGSDYLDDLTRRKPLKVGDKVDQLLLIYIMANLRRVTETTTGPAYNNEQLRALQLSLRKTNLDNKIELASEWLAERLRLLTSSLSSSSSVPKRQTSPTSDRWSPDSGIGANGADSQVDADADHFGFGVSAEASDIAPAMEAFCRRYELISKYKACAILANNCTLIRAEKQYLSKGEKRDASKKKKKQTKNENYNDDLGLSSLVSGRVALHVMKGDHETFLAINAKEISKIIS